LLWNAEADFRRRIAWHNAGQQSGANENARQAREKNEERAVLFLLLPLRAPPAVRVARICKLRKLF
jgi:hypothetical protein